jgi:hypothetical protein
VSSVADVHTGYDRRDNNMMCDICKQEKQTTWYQLPVLGYPVGIDVCVECQMLLARYVESMMVLATRSRSIGYQMCKEINAGKAEVIPCVAKRY